MDVAGRWMRFHQRLEFFAKAGEEGERDRERGDRERESDGLDFKQQSFLQKLGEREREFPLNRFWKTFRERE